MDLMNGDIALQHGASFLLAEDKGFSTTVSNVSLTDSEITYRK